MRERSARSVPMGQTRASRTSLSAGTPDSLSDNESSFRLSTRKTSTPYRSAITPGMFRYYKINKCSIVKIKFYLIV